MFIFETHSSFNVTRNLSSASNDTAEYQQKMLLMLTYTKIVEAFLAIFIFSSLFFISTMFLVWVLMLVMKFTKNEPEEDIDYFVRGFEDENAARIRAAIASDLPPAYSTLDVRTLGKDEELEDPPEYSKAVVDGTETTLRRNSSMFDVSQNENRQALFEQKLKLFKSLDLY